MPCAWVWRASWKSPWRLRSFCSRWRKCSPRSRLNCPSLWTISSLIAGYRDRLENKLRHKIGQIQRTERLLETLPADQKPAFRVLLEEACAQREEIKLELDELYRLLEQYTPPENP